MSKRAETRRVMKTFAQLETYVPTATCPASLKRIRDVAVDATTKSQAQLKRTLQNSAAIAAVAERHALPSRTSQTFAKPFRLMV